MKILMIDDSSSERIYIKALLGKLGHQVVLAADGQAGIALFADSDPDLILLDVMMAGLDGYETARVIRASSDQWVPIIFLSGRHESDAIEAGIDAGGDDYLTKPVDPKVLEAKIRSMTRIAQMRRQLVDRGAELKAANAALMRLVDVDGLTGIANRRRLDAKIAEEIARCARNHLPLALILIDIDHFKRFNDSHGHLVGDECLKQVAQALERELQRPADLAARYGGEEFCVVLPETNPAGALMLAERLRACVAAIEVSVGAGPKAGVTISVGVNCDVPPTHGDARVLLARADAALYEAKAGGRNRVCIAAPAAPAQALAAQDGAPAA